MLIILTGLVDTITFLDGDTTFEINPIYGMTGSIPLLLLVKWGIIATFIVILSKYQPTEKRFTTGYMLIYMSIMIIIGQGLGAYTNISTQNAISEDLQEHNGVQTDVVPMQGNDGMKLYAIMAGLMVYLPMIFGTITYYITERCYIRED